MPVVKIRDDLGRELLFGRSPERIVSLVPSDTHSVIALGAGARLVGRTRYCPDPGTPASAGALHSGPAAAGVAVIGGTKDVDVDAVIALEPQLVIANQEENTRPALEALAAARVLVLVSLPRTVAQGTAHLARLARILGVADREPAKSLIRRAYALAPAAAATRAAFVPIWMDPLMTINADTFGSDVLARAGVRNAFGDRLRLYPLAADLGKSAPRDAAGRDVRYPRVTLDEVRARGAQLVVLPDEPYAFTAEDEAVLRGALPGARVVRIDGKDLFWYGAWSVDAIARLTALLADG